MEYPHEMQAENYIELGQRLREELSPTPSAPPPSPSDSDDSGGYPLAHSTRLRSINKMISELEDQRSKREALVNRYKKLRRGAQIVDHTCTGLAVGSTAAGIAVLTTIVGAPIAIGIQSAGLGFGCGTLITKYMWRKVNLKIKKHQKILEVCQSTLQDIRAATSTALSNNHISDVQYREVIDLHRKFDQLKRGIQREVGAKISDLKQQNIWMEQGRKDAIKQLEKSLFQRTFSRRSRDLSNLS